jgi:hypothetical protein
MRPSPHLGVQQTMSDRWSQRADKKLALEWSLFFFSSFFFDAAAPCGVAVGSYEHAEQVCGGVLPLFLFFFIFFYFF